MLLRGAGPRRRACPRRRSRRARRAFRARRSRAPSRRRPRPCTGSSASCRGSSRRAAGSPRPRGVPSGSTIPSTSPRQPSRTPATSQPRSSARRVTARMTAFSPGQSPPPVRMPSLAIGASLRRRGPARVSEGAIPGYSSGQRLSPRRVHPSSTPRDGTVGRPERAGRDLHDAHAQAGQLGGNRAAVRRARRRRDRPLGADGRPDRARDPRGRLRAHRRRDHRRLPPPLHPPVFETYPAVRYTFAVLGEMAVEGDVLAWVSDHRKHHQFSDQEGDPHSPHVGYGDGVVAALRGLWHAHTGWLFSAAGRAEQSRYAKDLLRDRGLRVIAQALPAARALLARCPGARRLAPDRRLVRLLRRPLLGWGRPDLPAPPRHLLDQLDLPLLGPPPVRVARRVAERLVALLALLRRVVAQQPPRVPDLGVPWPAPHARSTRAAG